MSADKNTITPEEYQALLSEKDSLIANQARRIALLEEMVRLQNQKRFGSSSEKSPDQQEMFNEAELTDAAEQCLPEQETEPAQAINTDSPQNGAKKKPGRKPLPEDLPRIRVEHDLPEEALTCSCGCQRTVIGEETSEQLEIIPAKMQVIVNVRKKYACKQCEGSIKTADLPPQPIPKSNASPGLLAHIVVSKFQDALPLYRQELMLQRAGIELGRNTLASWVIKSGELIQPLINLLEDKLLAYPVMHCDETSVQVLKEPGKEATSKSYMWVRVGGPPTQPIRLFHYADNRGGDVARQLLNGYQGYVQTDDYAGYNGACSENGITQLGCWAHARRKFVEAQKANSKNKTSGKADMAVNLIGVLYRIEKRIKDNPPEEKYRVRQEETVLQLQKIREWLDKTLHNTLPKGLLGKAVAYLDKNWDKLTVYTQDGGLNIDNNPAENAIRPFVVGRKNWLFSATVPGAKASANLYGLIETAKSNGLEPYQYLRHVFTVLPKAATVEAIEALLPWNLDLQGGVY
jgi:transposase